MIQFGNNKIKEIYRGLDEIKEVYYGSELVWRVFKPSYAILTNGTRVDFEIENTPIRNFCSTSTSMVINGVSYTKRTIKEIHFKSSYSEVTEIGGYFLYNCSSLTNVTLDFPALNSVDTSFLLGCSSLTNVMLNFPTLNSVGYNFLYECTSLTDIILDFPALNSVGGWFLYNCSSLTNVTLDFPAISTVGSYFLQGCSSLVDITLDFPVLSSINNSFLHGCSSLTNIRLTTETPPIADKFFFLRNTDYLSSIYVPANSVNLYKTTAPWSDKANLIKPLSSCIILTNGKIVTFELENTPIANFYTYFDSSPNIDGIPYNKDTIKEIHFRSSYSGVTEIGVSFLRNYTSLTKVTLNLPALNNVGNYFLYGCPSLTKVTLTAETPPIAGIPGFIDMISNLSSIYVPSISVNLYKTTVPWSDKSSIIKAV